MLGFIDVFINDFCKITKPLTILLEKDAPFDFNDDCLKGFSLIKEKLTNSPMLVSPNWSFPFELTCDASDFDIGAILGWTKGTYFQPIHYANKTFTEA